MVNLVYKSYTEIDFLAKYDLLSGKKRILNVGSGSLRYGTNCVNLDIQEKDNVDVICDIHELPDSLGEFDAIICNAVLQYCNSPAKVANELYRVLKSQGYLYVDAPWIQPFCKDTPDRFRFSQEALRLIFSDFDIVEIGSSIPPGSALAMLGVYIARTLTTNKYINFGLGKIATFLLFPLRWIRTADESSTAGAFYMIARKSS